jgi:DNA-binding CsgD family transcriptional regulator
MAWGATVTAGHLGDPNALLETCQSVRALPPLPEAPHPLELLLDGLALVVTDGRAVATPVLQRAASAVAEMSVEDVVLWGWIAPAASAVTWDFDRYGAIFERQAQLVRNAGALAELPQHLTGLAWHKVFTGDLGAARLLVAEIDSITAATGTPLPPFAALRLRSLQGHEADATPLIEATIRQATAAGQGLAATTAHWAAAVLYNGLARYEQAAAEATEAATHALAPFMTNFALPELVEAAARQGDTKAAVDALERLAETTRPNQTDWAVGMEARCRALLANGDDAEEGFRNATNRFSRTRLRPELARTHLLYGEWLRREGRRDDARERLRIAHHMFVEIGMNAFAERAARELASTGEKVRRRGLESHDELTEQEEQIARLAREGLSNREIGVALFLSGRTVEWHLRKVFTKLGISSRDQLRAALPDSALLPER